MDNKLESLVGKTSRLKCVLKALLSISWTGAARFIALLRWGQKSHQTPVLVVMNPLLPQPTNSYRTNKGFKLP